jgi:hypothetical protein
LDIFGLEQEAFLFKRRLDKQLLKSPFAFDYLFSDYINLLLRIDGVPNNLSDLGECENACATSDAYKLAPLIEDSLGDFDKDEYFKIVNTGTIGKYYLKWGKREMTYLKHKYLHPVVSKKEFLSLFSNSYAIKAPKPKIIIKGLNLLDACLDVDGSVIPGKTTLMVTSHDIKTLRYLLAILNSKLAFFYIRERYPASSYNQGTTFTKEMINNLPLPKTTQNKQNDFINIVDTILSLTESDDFVEDKEKQASVQELEHQIDQMVYELYGLGKLSGEEIKTIELQST